MRLTWNRNPEPDLSHYKIYKRQAGDQTPMRNCQVLTSHVVDVGTGTTNVYYDNSISTSTATPYHWEYATDAFDTSGNQSKLSQIVTAAPPETPRDLTATGENHQVTLQWRTITEGYVDGYEIKRMNATHTTATTWTVTRVCHTSVDSSLTNGNVYYYSVRAYDGARNYSRYSEEVQGVPGPPNIRTYSTVIFEDLTSHNQNWDYLDIGAHVNTTLYLVNDNVTTVTIGGVCMAHDSSARYDLNVTIDDFEGTGTYTVLTYEYNKKQTHPHTGTYNPSVAGMDKIPMFDHVNLSNGDFRDSISTITLKMSNPSRHPIGTFDIPPFDIWVVINPTDTNPRVYHAYDPETGDHADDGWIVLRDRSPLLNLFLNSGFVIPIYDFYPPSNNEDIWAPGAYPYFLDYARTYRNFGGGVLNPDWYKYPAN
ncbi:hypothetical protein EG834_09655 [bacterium]|nr:hypothetical protein [bacterium]